METWKEKAIELLLTHREDIEAHESIDDLWDSFDILFVDAHQKNPADSKTIAAIYDYARWCLNQSGDRWISAQGIDFFESLPDDAIVWEELPKHMSYKEFQSLDELLRYYRTPEKYRIFIEFAVAQFVAHARQERKTAAHRKPRPKRQRASVNMVD